MIAFLFTICIIVFVHEFGHYYVAKKSGIHVEEFSIGFGKELFSFKDKSKTKWKFCLIPMGGYVKMHGDEDVFSSDTKKKNTHKINKSKSFSNKSSLIKMAVVVAGPIMNFIFAIFAFFLIKFFVGDIIVKPIITKLHDAGPAKKADIKVGDKIIGINNKSVTSFSQIMNYVSISGEKPIKIKIDRDGVIKDFLITPKKLPDDHGALSKTPLLGIMSDAKEHVRYGILDAMISSVNDTTRIIKFSSIAISQLFMGKRSLKEIGGPITIAKYSSESAKYGIVALVQFMSLISINLGLINLLPIPLLDGGHFMIYGIELITNRKISKRLSRLIYFVGIGFIMILTLLGIVNDLLRLFNF